MAVVSKRLFRSLATALALAAAAVLVLFFAHGSKVIGLVQRGARHTRATFQQRLLEKHGIVFLASLDEAVPEDAITIVPVPLWNAPRVAGKFGSARRIKSANDSVLRQPPSVLVAAMPCATYAAWIRPDAAGYVQRIFDMRTLLSGFAVDFDGNDLIVTFVCGEGIPEKRSRIPFAGGKGFTHLAVVMGQNYAALYQNGREEWRTDLPDGTYVPSRPLVFGATQHAPYKGDIDDLAIWRRALTPEEIAAIARSRRSLRNSLEPALARAIAALDGAYSFLSSFYRVFDRLLPGADGPVVLRTEIPTFTARMANSAERHFKRAHEESLRFGYRTRKAANFKPATFVANAKVVKGFLALDDVYGLVSGAKRPAYLFKDDSRTLVGGSGLLRLYPPELHEALHPDAPRPLPLNASFVKFSIGNSFKGLYVAEPFDGVGGAWVARGHRDASFKKAIGYGGPPAPCDVPPRGKTLDEAFRATATLVLSDAQFPWSRQELVARSRGLALKRKKLRFRDETGLADTLLREIAVGSPSPMFVTTNLCLSVPGIASWKSSDPSLVSPDGAVHRPADGAPRAVVLTPVLDDGAEGPALRLRVAPEKPSMQALFLHLRTPVQKMRRSDFSCLRIPAGGGEPQWLTGTGASGGGVKHRGNTSYVKGVKRSMSLEFDNLVDWPGASRPATHVLLYSGYADPTRLRNKISFDSFIATNDSETPHYAPDVTWTEVFVNGMYFGVWETSRRVKDLCDEGTLLYKVRAHDPNLWASDSVEMTECTTFAAADSENHYEPLERLFGFVAHASKKKFAAEAPRRFWLNNIVDFMLVLRFSGNEDGRVTNQYISQRPGENRWFLVPWDYDKTFLLGKDRTTRTLSNHLFNRLKSNVPGFADRVKDRWHELRAGPLSDEAVFGRIDADAAFLAPYMEEEYRLLQPAGEEGTFADAVGKLKAAVAERLKMMDDAYADTRRK